MANTKLVHELDEQTRSLAVAAYTTAHGFRPDLGFAPDRAWIMGWVYAQQRAPQAAATQAAESVLACTECGGQLKKVVQDSNSYLSADQFEADKLGDWFCDCCPRGPSHGSSRHRYFWNAALAAPAAREGQDSLTQAARDVLAERARQISTEGRTPEQDDRYRGCELAKAAAAYAHAATGLGWMVKENPPPVWPWPKTWWKPTTARRDLEKAGALILAEIERIDRAAIAASAAQGEA